VKWRGQNDRASIRCEILLLQYPDVRSFGYSTTNQRVAEILRSNKETSAFVCIPFEKNEQVIRVVGPMENAIVLCSIRLSSVSLCVVYRLPNVVSLYAKLHYDHGHG